MQLPCKHFSLKAHSRSDLQWGIQMLSLHVEFVVQSVFDEHAIGTETEKNIIILICQ